MIVWQGLGILALVIPAVLGGIAQWGVDAHFGVGYAKSHSWHNAIAWTIGAAVVWWMGSSLAKRPGRVLVDAVTNEQIEFKEKHTMFWVPMHYWAFVLVAVSVGSLIW